MKKTYLAISFTLALIFLLAACGAPQDSGTGSDAGFPPLASFTAQTIDGGEFTERDFAQADVTMINIWSTTCSPCIREMPELAELEQSLPDNVRLITYCIDGADNYETASGILADAGFTGITLISGDGDLEKLYYSLEYTPTTLFVDDSGNMIGEVLIGAAADAVSYYTEGINQALSALGKDEI